MVRDNLVEAPHCGAALAGVNVCSKAAAKHMHIVDVPARAGSRGRAKARPYIPFSSSSLINFAV